VQGPRTPSDARGRVQSRPGGPTATRRPPFPPDNARSHGALGRSDELPTCQSANLPTAGAEHDAQPRTWAVFVMHACESRTGCQPPSAHDAHVVHAASAAQGPTDGEPADDEPSNHRSGDCAWSRNGRSGENSTPPWSTRVHCARRVLGQHSNPITAHHRPSPPTLMEISAQPMAFGSLET
jgi:hypothetical protein